MHKIIENGDDKLLAIKFKGTVTKEDYDVLLPVLKEKINKHGKINLYWEMIDFDGWDLISLAREIKFDITHASSFEKVAIVGNKKWEQFVTVSVKPFTKAQIKFFSAEEQLEAMNWITASRNESLENEQKLQY